MASQEGASASSLGPLSGGACALPAAGRGDAGAVGEAEAVAAAAETDF